MIEARMNLQPTLIEWPGPRGGRLNRPTPGVLPQEAPYAR